MPRKEVLQSPKRTAKTGVGPPTPPPPIWHSPQFGVHKSVGDQRDASHSAASCVVALGTMVAVLVVLLIMKRAWLSALTASWLHV